MAEDIINQGITEMELVELPTDEKQKKEENQGTIEALQLKNLAESPAWKKVRKEFDEEINRIEKFDYVDFSHSNEKVGAEVKANKFAAEKLRAFMAKIDNSITEEGAFDDES